jgi:hypothetical protein
VSVGATLLRPGEDSSTVVDRADRLMYRAKHAGRNVVVTESGAQPKLTSGAFGPTCGGQVAGP